jgi:hypothetical protein
LPTPAAESGYTMRVLPPPRSPWRRRLAPVLVLLGVGVLVWELWFRERGTVDGTVVLDFGVQTDEVLAIDVDVRAGASSVGSFHRARAAAPIGRPRFRITLPSSDVTFSAVIRLRRGVRTIERQVHVPDDGEVTVSYEAELTAIK